MTQLLPPTLLRSLRRMDFRCEVPRARDRSGPALEGDRSSPSLPDCRAQAGPRKRTRIAALLASLVLMLSACTTPAAHSGTSATSSATSRGPARSTKPGDGPVKLLVIVEENHSLSQMSSGMPYLFGLAQRFSYANQYTAVAHPSLPNYLAIAGGDTFGVSDDREPSAHPVLGRSVFGQAAAAGLTAGTYAESMPSNCATTGNAARGYAVKHNPWAYFVDEQSACRSNDVPESGFLAAVRADSLPNAAMLVPNRCNDGHDSGCGLGSADAWLQARLPAVLASNDFTSGALAIVVTADEDDRASGYLVLTVVLHASLDGSHRVVTTPLTHYSLSRLYSQVIGAPPLRRAATAPDMAAAFHLPVR